MSGADEGFRYGSKKDMWPAGGEWVHVEGRHPKYDAIRSDEFKLDVFDGGLKAVERELARLLDGVRMIRCLLLGGHVRRDKLGALGDQFSATDDPETALTQLKALVDTAKREGISGR